MVVVSTWSARYENSYSEWFKVNLDEALKR